MFTGSVFPNRPQNGVARLLKGTSCAATILGVSARATPPLAFNPDHLNSERLSRVADICQTVMGLSPTEPLSGGYWRGDDQLRYYTSHYRGCIRSLSDSLIGKVDARAARQADAQCRASGEPNGSPALALCELDATKRIAATLPGPSVAIDSKVALPAASRSLFYASPEETVSRENKACAALGLDPSGGAFTSCMENLDRTFFAIDNPII